MGYRVLGRDKLVKFWKRHADAKRPLEAWYQEASQADWKTSQDIKDRYASASFLAGNRVVFNIKGNDYRLLVQMHYQRGLAVIQKVGTHTDYDKWSL